MNVARAILAFVITVSLAILPAAGHAGVAVQPVDVAATDQSVQHEHSMAATHDAAAMDAMDCCPHKTDTSKKAIDDCAAMAGCVLCTGFLGTAPLGLNFVLLLSSRAFSPPTDPLPSQAGSPPFRPPRI
jgi:hypothetical protein